MLYDRWFKNPEDVPLILEKIRKYSDQTGPIRLMEVCGTHTMAIARMGLKSLLPREVRLIIRVFLADGSSVVVRFKNEKDVSLELLESQCRFAQLLHDRRILTPQYQSGQSFARWYTIGGYQVIVTVEEFAEGEVRVVDPLVAEKTGALLARTHNIAEECNAHVDNDVIFDPFKRNDLLFYPEFAAYEPYCRFQGCSHISEPDCGVKQALADGKISELRYGNYKLLYEELKSVKKY